jgi:hypothetical protein
MRSLNSRKETDYASSNFSSNPRQTEDSNDYGYPLHPIEDTQSEGKRSLL